ncbi:hypothetical protein PFUGPA_01553 [Plasmodium falciparum Palo Alto/Uganda]|uniref:Uncharacterized protein n=3 Tax=Plasmodium falciparum TaxID=5833 RepID=W4J266_PLAFP|nr:hypothetical protein PFTANZ_03055 [Plasmodium falciparum Tanzania (2000708)]ETW49026.1 hypothetical protein PFMALIP_02983 [Plasmodium falciparum MaliPS096_E11]ETW56378.1 hypothetical protein PFUGPA_01553 [Plasmodium falciparum Palo Alto/Uganda]
MFMPKHNYHDNTQSSAYNNNSIFNKNNPFLLIDSYNDTPRDFRKITNKKSNNIHYNINAKRIKEIYFCLYHEKEDKLGEENINYQLKYFDKYNRSYNNN